ncbi:hypothetical protein VTK73DRAFT_7349 [Phialemonium thermophilum]|uniref:U3 small nucleolar RNA-associated protein 10 n=1 Tax=Phialemonium thermophilum TaxID=223376 RepID=A0ABR3WEW6_9PEZI
MASALASQLAQIAAASKNSLNLKTQRAAHSKSLIFEPKVAAGQSFQTIYTLCHEGFQDLCRLDTRFIPFGNTLFSEQSQEEDRTQFTAAENEQLDKKIDAFLRLVGSRLRLMPAIKAIEWLIRRFRVHEFNTASLLTTFLPYHSIPAFVTLMSILPSNIPPEYRFLDPYIRSLTSPPRAAIIQHATGRPEFLSFISTYTLTSCKSRQDYPALISFWGGIMTEAINAMLDKTRSGRKSVQANHDVALLQLITPILSESLVMKKSPGIQIASYMAMAILASKANLSDAAIAAFMEQLVHGWTGETWRPGLVCLSILAQYRSARLVPGKVAKALLKVPELVPLLRAIGQDYAVDRLASALSLALTDRLYKKGDVRGLPVIQSVLLGNMLSERQTKMAYTALLLAAHRINSETDKTGDVQRQLASTLVALSRAGGEVGETIRKTIDEVEFDIEELEFKLETMIRPPAIEAPTTDDEAMTNGVVEFSAQHDIGALLEHLSPEKHSLSDCFPGDSDSLYSQLYAIFLSLASTPEGLAKFDEAPILRRSSAPSDVFYLSFYIRVWCSSSPTLARITALERVRQRLKSADCADVDFQFIIPYTIAALRDPSKKVRRAASELIVLLASLYGTARAKPRRWAAGSQTMRSVQAMDENATQSLLDKVLLPSLEESILDDNHVSVALKESLDHSKSAPEAASPSKKHGLSHAIRLSIMTTLSTHVIHSPFLLVKVRILDGLNLVRAVSGTSRTLLLLPVLRWWAGLSREESDRLAAKENLDVAIVDTTCVDVVAANDKTGLDCLFELIKTSQVLERPNLLQNIFMRIRKVWPSLKGEARFSAAQAMLELSYPVSHVEPRQDMASIEAADLLRNVELSTAILIEFLESCRDSAKAIAESPANKRRRVSSSDHNRSISMQNSPEMSAILNRITFVLELIQGSKPQEHPQLLQSLFTTLSDLQHLRTLVGSELGYLQNLVLSSLLAMMPAYRNNKGLQIDASVGHGDVLVTCIQRSSSPAVQNAALLLVASLAKTAPDVVLHSVMPIFTFMGGSVLRQADDYSAHVVNQTIKEVIPPLIDTFRKNRRNIVASAVELLSSFVVAYEHMPSHRKHDLFLSLVESLGPRDFLFAILAMFVDRYGTTDSILAFLSQITSSFSVEVQLESFIKLLDLVRDSLKPKPALSAILLGRNDETDRESQKIALRELTLLPHLLNNRRLKQEIEKLTDSDDMEASKIRDLYATLLEDILTMADILKATKPLYNRCGDILSNLLNLLSIGEFIKSVETLLDRPNVALRQKVLRGLELRVDRESTTDPRSRTALLAFLPQLTAVIRESTDVQYKHTAIVCVDKISEKYGKKDIEAVTAAAATIAGDQCLGQSSDRLRIMALLCLASLVDVLQDAIVPVLPVAIPKALSYLRESLPGENPDIELHNASYAFMTSLAQHLPYMISGSYLDELLRCSNVSAEAGLDEEANDSRLQCLKLLARLVDAKVLFTALEQNWADAADSGFSALTEYLQILVLALEKHPKSVIAKNVPALSSIFTKALDLRRMEQYRAITSGHAVARLKTIEDTINDAALKMIYKLNDATFRPVFGQLVEFSTSGLPSKDRAGRVIRQQSVYGFMYAFFSNLKSIVTNYASYILDSAATILREANLRDSNELELWRRVLRMLAQCFEHDQDGFWQAPSHFNAVAPVLVQQFERAPVVLGAAAATAATTELLVPALVELAAAADSQEHQKELNGALLKLLRSEQSVVRLAVVLCQQALTDRLGEDWLSMLPEMLPYISELQDDDDEVVERETHRWIVKIEGILGESLDSMLQ